jgi:integrase
MAATGIRQRHGRACDGEGRCKCPWEGSVYSRRDGKKIREQFPTRAAAIAWRDDSRSAVRKRVMRAPTQRTVGQAAQAWLEGAAAGVIRPRSGDAYKPSAIRAYEAAWRLRLEPELGRRKLSGVTRNDVQDLVDGLIAQDLNPSTIGTTMNLLRNVFGRAMKRNEVAVNPTTGLEMPAVRGGRDRIASPSEGTRLLAALAAGDRALWATAMYGGLRRGELMALQVQDIDLGAGKIHVRRGWDTIEGEIAPKSTKGDRRVPVSAALRDRLDEHLLGLGWSAEPEGLAFGVTASVPFSPTPLTKRAYRAWGWKQMANPDPQPAAPGVVWVKAHAGALDRITLHECRHTYASLMIAAGVNAKTLSTYMGHATVSITLDRYGHLFPGNEAEAAGLLDAYLERADTAARLAALDA